MKNTVLYIPLWLIGLGCFIVVGCTRNAPHFTANKGTQSGGPRISDSARSSILVANSSRSYTDTEAGEGQQQTVHLSNGHWHSESSHALASVKRLTLVQKFALAHEVRQTLKQIRKSKASGSSPAISDSPTDYRRGKSQITAMFLCLFLFPLAMHRFYLGYTFIGIIQLLTCGGYGIWYLIDFIRIIQGDLEPKGEPYEEIF